MIGELGLCIIVQDLMESRAGRDSDCLVDADFVAVFPSTSPGLYSGLFMYRTISSTLPARANLPG